MSDALAQVRAICLALPEVTERLSHRAPSSFVRGKKTLVMHLDGHHGDGRLALWCPAPPAYRMVAPKRLVAVLDERR